MIRLEDMVPCSNNSSVSDPHQYQWQCDYGINEKALGTLLKWTY